MTNPTLKERLAKLPPEKRQRLLAELARRKQQPTNGTNGTTTPPPRTPGTTNNDSWPLSFAQRRLWFLDQFTPASFAYNIPAAIQLTGQLDIATLQASLNAIISRHRVLHQIYTTIDEEPRLILHPDPTLYLGLTAVSSQNLQHHINTAAAQPFDLSRDLPIRAHLFQLADDDHVLQITLHHITADGWSMSLLFKELSILYNQHVGTSNGRSLPTLPCQYDDYAQWQQNWLNGDTLDKQLTYWQQQLADAPTTLDLPTDRSRPPTRSFAGAIHGFELPSELTTAVLSAARQANVSLYMYLLTAFTILLHRYSNKHDILIGSPVAGRNQTETENLIGLFLNTIVIRAKLADNPTVADLLSQIRATTLDAFEQQHVPFEKLVEALQLERNLSHNPLIQVMFNIHNTPPSELSLTGLTAVFLPTDIQTAKFDLNVAFAETANGLRGSISYSTDLFDAATIERMAGHFEQIVRGMVANPNQPISHIPLLTAAEKAWLADWNDTAKAYPAVSSMVHLFEEQAARHPDKTAVIFEGNSYTYHQLNQHANQLARQLQQLGAGREKCVGLLLERSLEMMVGLLGILKAGAAYVPLDPSYPPDRIQTIASDADIMALVTHSELLSVAPRVGETAVLQIDSDWPTIAQQPSHNLDLDIAPTDLMYILFTSGSTGKPKGVIVENRNYISYFQAVFERMGVENGLTYAVATTFATDLGSIMFWSALCSGGSVHIISYERATDPAAFAAYFRQHPIDVLKLVPSHLDALLLLGETADIVPNHLLVLAGETSYWETINAIQTAVPHCTIQDHYGVTETTGIMLTYAVPQASDAPARTGALPKGQPLANTQLYILDAHRQTVPIGIPGEVYIGGNGVTRGYLNRPDLTKQLFIPNPFSSDPTQRLYRTGDLAAYQADGTVKLLGRGDFQIKIRGYRVELGEIENALNKMPELERSVVMAQSDTTGDTQLIVYIATQQSGITADFIRQQLRETLPDYMVPATYLFLDALPINANGKIDRPALKAIEKPLATAAAADFIAPRNPQEETLAVIWCDILDLPQVSIDDNFFDIGGESFKAIRVVRKIGAGVSVMDLFQNPTIRQLAAFLAADTPHQSTLLYELTPPIPPAKRRLTLVCIPYGGGSAAVYHPLAQQLPDDVSLFAVELPGHDFSRREEEKRPLTELAAACVAEIQAHVTGAIGLYGHCVGSALAVEIGRLLEAANLPLVGIFLGGNFPSPRPKQLEFFHKYFPVAQWTSSRVIYEAMRGVGGFTDVLDPAEQTFVIDNMRDDVRQASDYYTIHSQQPAAPLNAPICCIVAQEDPATEFYQERAADWLTYSSSVTLQMIPNAGHYFLKHQASELGDIIAAQTSDWQTGGTGKTAVSITQTPQTTSFNIFLLVAFGQLISMIGTGLTTFTLGVWALAQSNSLIDFTIISIFALLPGILVSPLAGAAADRWDRRKVMIGSDVLAACGTLLVAWLLWTDSLQVWHIYITASIGSVANAFQRPAYIAAIAQLVPKRHLGRANGIAQLAANTGRVLAPLLGGLLYVTFSLSTIVLIDFATFLFAVGTLLLLRFPNTLFRRREEPFMQELLGGWHYIMKRPSLIAMVVFMVIYNFFSSFATVLITPLVLAFGDAALLGTVMSAFGLGLIGGALAMSIWGGMRRRAEGLVLFTTLTGISLIITGWRPHALFLTIGLFTLGVFFALIDSHWQAIIQTKVGFRLQGRVVSINQMLVWMMMPIGFFLAGVFTDSVFEPFMQSASPLATQLGNLLGTGAGRGIGLMLIVIGLLQIMWGILGWFSRPLRFMENHLPDAIPDAVVASERNQLQQLADAQLS
ncbi:MAG: amino acid adenylation domain-containing protein [Chloroflexota bacterium]